MTLTSKRRRLQALAWGSEVGCSGGPPVLIASNCNTLPEVIVRTSRPCECRATGVARAAGAYREQRQRAQCPPHQSLARWSVEREYTPYPTGIRPQNCVLTSIHAKAHIVVADPIIS